MLRLRELREEIGKTQQEIAQIFQISRQVYANYENGINEPSMEMLVKFADFFDCTTDFLLSREDSDFGIISVQKEKSSDLSEEEKTLIRDYRALAPALQEMLRSTIQTWKGSQANSTSYGAERRRR